MRSRERVGRRLERWAVEPRPAREAPRPPDDKRVRMGAKESGLARPISTSPQRASRVSSAVPGTSAAISEKRKPPPRSSTPKMARCSMLKPSGSVSGASWAA